MPKKISRLFIVVFLGIILISFFGNVKDANAQFVFPSDCTPGLAASLTWAVCTGTPPPAYPGCVLLTGGTVDEEIHCTQACDMADGYVLRYDSFTPTQTYWCCAPSGSSQCTLGGTTINLGIQPPPTSEAPCQTECNLAGTLTGQCLGCIAKYTLSIPVRIALTVPALAIALLGILAGSLYMLVVTIVNWITNITLTIPITPSNPDMDPSFIVAQAWRFTRDFADMFLILILVFIGLATILKIKEYEVRKLLPGLIIVALLINFSPVLVGFMVDFGNILAKVFFDAANQLNSPSRLVSDFGGYLNQLGGIWTQDGDFYARLFAEYDGAGNYAAEFIGLFAYGIILCSFYLYATAIYLIVGWLLIYRIVWLWILVILAPIAFLFSILPATKKIYMLGWHDWMGQLFQWVILGIPIGFFLWISNWIMANTNIVSDIFNRTSNLRTQVAGTITQGSLGFMGDLLVALIVSILAPLIAIIILQMGVKFSKKMAPEAALKMVEGMEKAFKIAGAVALTAATMGAGAAIGAKALSGLAKAGGKVDQAAGKVGLRTTFGTALEKRATALRRGSVNIEKDMKDLGIENDPVAQEAYVNRQGTAARKLEAVGWMAKNGTLGKGSEKLKQQAADLAEKFKDDPHHKKETNDIADHLTSQISAKVKVGLEVGKEDQDKMQTQIKETAAKLSQEVEMKPVIDKEAERLVGTKLFKNKDEARDSAAQNVAARYIHFTEQKSGDIKNQAKSSIESAVAARTLRDMTPQHLQAIQNNFKTETINKVLDQTFGKMFEGKNEAQSKQTLMDYYSGGGDPSLANKHARMVHWAEGTPAGKEMNLPMRKYIDNIEYNGKKKYDALDAYRDAEVEEWKKKEAKKEWIIRPENVGEGTEEASAEEFKEGAPSAFRKEKGKKKTY